MKILVINPGSTSTKIAVFDDQIRIFQENIHHDSGVLQQFASVLDQDKFRQQVIEAALRKHGITLAELDAVIGRGGLVRPVAGGVYRICDNMLSDLRSGRFGVHASNLGAILAHCLTRQTNMPCFIADPVVVDELAPLARYSGHPHIARRSIFHALNQKAVARRAAHELGRKYEDMHLIVAHLGGGISVGAHVLGQVIDVNNALDGDGPFSPERSGGLPAGQLVDWCFSGCTHEEIRRGITGRGGLLAYLGTANGMEVEARVRANDPVACEVYEAMAYQVAKEIGAMSTVLKGRQEAIVLTGGLMHDAFLGSWIQERVEFLAPVRIYPGEDEMTALCESARLAIQGLTPVHQY